MSIAIALIGLGVLLWQVAEHAYLKGFKDGTAWADGRPFDERRPTNE